MHPAFLDTLAHVHNVPAPAVLRVAATVAERCELIANRFATPSARSSGLDALVGAHIGAAILAEFGQEDAAGTPAAKLTP